MKNQQRSALQFTGYPLKLKHASPQSYHQKAPLFVLPDTPTKDQIRSFFRVHKMANDPAHWDAEWFGNYE
ncbi:MAG TPA: hypothetical protein VGB46_02870 [Flavisolibacter sp.]|jgi:hypothetical protein